MASGLGPGGANLNTGHCVVQELACVLTFIFSNISNQNPFYWGKNLTGPLFKSVF